MRDVMGTSPTSNSFRQPAGPAFALSNPSTYSDTPASQSSYPLPIPSDRLPGFSQDGGRPSQDAEEAAMALEHLAMGRSQYGGLGMSNVPCVGTPNSYEKVLSLDVCSIRLDRELERSLCHRSRVPLESR